MIFSIAGFSQNYTIQTFAGGGDVPQNIQAIYASLGSVTGVATDPGGNVYIALQTYSAVLRMDAAGSITLVAGTGTPGYSGDNGPATSAQLNAPWGIALDSAGNLYIADSGNNCIRKISNGVITTVSLGPGALQLSNPTGVAVDSSGNLYIADSGNQVVREVSGGVTVTVAGTGSPGLNTLSGTATSIALDSPWGVAVDAAGNLYIADFRNDSIREVSNGVITTIAYLQGMAPRGVAVDAAGDIFIAAAGLSTVAEKPANGILSEIAGSPYFTGYSGDTGPIIRVAISVAWPGFNRHGYFPKRIRN